MLMLVQVFAANGHFMQMCLIITNAQELLGVKRAKEGTSHQALVPERCLEPGVNPGRQHELHGLLRIFLPVTGEYKPKE